VGTSIQGVVQPVEVTLDHTTTVVYIFVGEQSEKGLPFGYQLQIGVAMFLPQGGNFVIEVPLSFAT